MIAADATNWPLLALEFDIRDFSVTEVTHRLCLKLQKTPNEILQQSVDSLLSPASRLYFLSAVEPKLRQGVDCEQLTLYLKDHEENIMCLVNAICQPDNKIAFIVMLADKHLLLERQLITEREQIVEINSELKRRQQELILQREQKAELLNKVEAISAEMLQTEKLASLGQMAAGIAHEINNPVAYIRSNLNTLSQYTQRLLNLVNNSGVTEQQKETADFDFLEADLLSLLNETQEGIHHITQTTHSLTQFTRSSGLSDWCDIHHQIDTTLKVMRNELRNKVDIRKHYGDIPQVYCDPAQVNQVLLNIFLNAAQSIVRFGYVDITTESINEQVRVMIDDTGCGMSEDVLSRAADPFYTTKPEGTGTGLGLSISHNIMRTLGGSMHLSSAVDKGTRVVLVFPAPMKQGEAYNGE
ncbi:sensor histidine kinase [Idiomarina sp. HP20-50]|uniref:sensor histidine kinase n=1 Tax=Idiomarina sp. HP20-50 TaxID=3070813 RepID=UPI00294B39D5|nr:ATP-binding protein [Idiomarina sp. HP20-50]MDV6316997.1 ATP-binding protein [Idiomarina sp. HP20-50]